MIKNNYFYYNNLKTVVIIGYTESLNEIKYINKKFKLETHFITSPSFLKKKNDKKIKIFSKLDKSFTKYILDNFQVEKTLFVSFGPRWIFNNKIIKNLFKNNLVNFHSSRLPLDAGGGGFSWRIMRNDRLGNCLVHLVDSGVDTGPILKSEEFIFSKACKIPSDFDKENNDRLLNFYEKFLNELKLRKKLKLKHQTQSLRRYNPRLNTQINGWIDWFNSSSDLYYFINAFDDPYKGASTYVNKTKVNIKSVHLHGGEVKNHPFSSGIIIRKNKDWVVVSTNDANCLLIEKVINSNNKNIVNELNEGDRFYTPYNKLVQSRSLRLQYNALSKKSYFKK